LQKLLQLRHVKALEQKKGTHSSESGSPSSCAASRPRGKRIERGVRGERKRCGSLRPDTRKSSETERKGREGWFLLAAAGTGKKHGRLLLRGHRKGSSTGGGEGGKKGGDEKGVLRTVRVWGTCASKPAQGKRRVSCKSVKKKNPVSLLPE